MKKTFKLMLATALLSFGSMNVFAQFGSLHGTTQYGADGFKYEIKSVYKTETAVNVNEVAISQNVYATQGLAAMVIPATVDIYVKGTCDDAGLPAIDKVVTFKVVEILPNGFENVTKATSVQIGSNIRTIGANAFDGCTNVTAITFAANANNVTIANDAFKGTKVTTLDLTPITGTLAAVNKWFNSAVFVPGTTVNNTLTTVTFPQQVTTIVADAFAGCKALTTVNFTEDTTAPYQALDLQAGAFQETPIVDLDLTHARINTLNKLFEDNNVTLKTVKMSKHVVTLAANALANCIQLNSVDFSKSTKLTTLNAGSLSNTVVASYDFTNCCEASGTPRVYTSFLNFTLGQDPFVNGTTTTNKNLVSVTLPKDAGMDFSPVTVFGTAFANCEKLTTINNIEISHLAVVEDYAFANDKSLAALTFPSTVTNVNDAPFGGCDNLAALTFNGNAQIGSGGTGLFDAAVVGPGKPVAAAAADGALTTLTINAVGTPNPASAAVIKEDAFGTCTAITTVTIAAGGTFTGQIEDTDADPATNPALVLKADANSTVTFGNIGAAADINSIVGPVGTFAATLTVGTYAAAATPAPIVCNNVGTATIGATSVAGGIEALGLASAIVFTGNITVAQNAPAVINDRLTSINFGTFTIPVGGIIATTFDETQAPNLTDVTWNPAAAAAVAAFAQAAFGTAAKGAAAKVTLHTTAEVADLPAYARNEAFLWNIIFDATIPTPDPVIINIATYGNASSQYYFGKYQNNELPVTNVAIDKIQNGEHVVVYSAFVDASDQTIYMDPLAIVDGQYVVEPGQAVVVRSAAGIDNVEAYATANNSTMRYTFGGVILNDLQVTPFIFSSDYIATNYPGKTLYAMKNPANEGKLVWGKIAATSYLPAGALFVETDEIAPAQLNIVWGDETDITGIIEKLYNADKAQNAAIYNLQGMQISAPVKGQIYIKNGKKYFVK